MLIERLEGHERLLEIINYKRMMFDVRLFLDNLHAKGYFGGKKLITYLISQGKDKQEIIDICLGYTRYNYKNNK